MLLFKLLFIYNITIEIYNAKFKMSPLKWVRGSIVFKILIENS